MDPTAPPGTGANDVGTSPPPAGHDAAGAGAAEVTLAYWREHREQFRQSENQRATMTNVILVAVAALTGFIAQQQASRDMTPAAVLIVLLGLYGAITTVKYHERADYHLGQAAALTRALVSTGNLPDLKDALDGARTQHVRTHRVFHQIRLHWLWTGLHLALVGVGVVLAVLTRQP
jgi:hypothetical protein